MDQRDVLSTTQIVKSLQGNCVTAPFFEGVYALDNLPVDYIFKRPALVVCNTAYSGSPGEHWVAFFLHRNGVDYFDPYGYPPRGVYLNNFIYLNKGSKEVTYNTYQLQSLTTSTCGKFATTYLYYRSKGMSTEQYIDLLGFDADKTVRRMFDELFGNICGPCRDGDQKCYIYGCWNWK